MMRCLVKYASIRFEVGYHMALYPSYTEVKAYLGQITQYKQNYHHGPGVGFRIFCNEGREQQKGKGAAPCL